MTINVFERSFELSDIPEYGTLKFYSELQEAMVELYRDGDQVYRRHCGTGRGCFWTEWETYPNYS